MPPELDLGRNAPARPSGKMSTRVRRQARRGFRRPSCAWLGAAVPVDEDHRALRRTRRRPVWSAARAGDDGDKGKSARRRASPRRWWFATMRQGSAGMFSSPPRHRSGRRTSRAGAVFRAPGPRGRRTARSGAPRSASTSAAGANAAVHSTRMTRTVGAQPLQGRAARRARSRWSPARFTGGVARVASGLFLGLEAASRSLRSM